MGDGKRAEGFWWVRLPKHTGRDGVTREGWSVAELRVSRGASWLLSPSWGCGLGVPLEWGPYLGKSPSNGGQG